MDNSTAAGPSGEVYEVPIIYSSMESDGGGDDESQDTSQRSKRRKKGKIWLFERKFPNISCAEEFVNNENSWSVMKVHDTSDGVKRYYRCNQVKRRASMQCSAGLYLLFDSSSDDILLFRTEDGHDHDFLEGRGINPMNEETKREIEKLVEMHMKPKSIMNHLSKIEGLVLPTMVQLNNHLKVLRKKDIAPAVSLSELESWLSRNSEIPDDDHQVYVAAYDVAEKESDPTFRFLLTTKYLISLARNCTVLHLDTTQKLTWQGSAVLIIGTTDRNKHFHPFGMAVTATAQTDDFTFLFVSLKNAVFSLFFSNLPCKVLVCDSAESVKGAFERVFGQDTIIRLCWAHSKKKIQTKVEQYVNKEFQTDILKDIDDLQRASNREVFDRACEKFLEKWKAEKIFLAYFESDWLMQNRFWYLGATPETSSTNHALETFKRKIKDSGAIRQNIPLERFLVSACGIVKDWSFEYVSNSERDFAHSPTVSLKMWKEAYQWAVLPKRVPLKFSAESACSYRVPAGADVECKSYESPWGTFDEYKEQHFSEWEVRLPHEKEHWLQGTCNCPKFLENYICEHLVGLAIRLNHVQPPPEAKVLVGPKRKRGRPPKAKPALLIL